MDIPVQAGKSLTPKRIQKIVEESLAGAAKPPYGFVLGAACDVSKAARDVFRGAMVAKGIHEFFIWAKGELEDMLFQPKNDHLLFAYFNLSLQPRRRSLAASLRAEIARKKQLESLMTEPGAFGTLILLRDPTDDRYPIMPKGNDVPPRWILCRALDLKQPGHLKVLWHEYLAATTPDCTGWDILPETDVAKAMALSELRSKGAWDVDARDKERDTAHDFWTEYIPEEDRAYLKRFRAVPIGRILAVDPLGDGYYPIPHLLIEFDRNNSPFSSAGWHSLERAGSRGGNMPLRPSDKSRVQIFPNPLPRNGEPAPHAFDQTATAKPLTKSASEMLTSILSNLSKGNTTNNSHPLSAARASRESQEKMRPFADWADKVALPVLSAFVERIRKEGHQARVVRRTVKKTRHVDSSDFIELRVQIQHNPGYCASGNLRFSMSEFYGFSINEWPPTNESKSAYHSAPTPKPELQEMNDLEVELRAIRLLERIHQSASGI